MAYLLQWQPTLLSPGAECGSIDTGSISLSIFLIVGAIVSYLPQCIKTARAKSHAGLSFINFGCASFVNLAGLLSYMTVKYSFAFQCCTEGYSTLTCLSHLSNFGIALVLAVSTLIIILQYFFYYDFDFEAEHFIKASTAASTQEALLTVRFRYKLKVGILVVAELVIGGVFAGLSLASGMGSELTSTYGEFLNYLSSAIILFHWAPQIYTTWKLQKMHSLSLVMVVIQSGGSFLTGAQVGGYLNKDEEKNFLLFVPFAIAGCMLFVLLFQAFFFWLRDRRIQRRESLVLHSTEANIDAEATSKYQSLE